jgi:hypothetical protein
MGSRVPKKTLSGPLLPARESGYNVAEGKRGDMRVFAMIAAALMTSAALAGSAHAATKRKHPLVHRSAASTVVQPTRTIIHNPDGTTTIIVTPRRSYLDPGTDVSVGDGSRFDYMLPPGGDPGRPDWWEGPDTTGGAFMVTRPFYLPGFNPNTPY